MTTSFVAIAATSTWSGPSRYEDQTWELTGLVNGDAFTGAQVSGSMRWNLHSCGGTTYELRLRFDDHNGTRFDLNIGCDGFDSGVIVGATGSAASLEGHPASLDYTLGPAPLVSDPLGLGLLACNIAFPAYPRPPCPAVNPTVLAATLTIR